MCVGGWGWGGDVCIRPAQCPELRGLCVYVCACVSACVWYYVKFF